MNEDKVNKNKEEKGEEEMSVAIEKKEDKLKEMLKNIRSKADRLTGKGNMIELDPNNPQHREWYEEDKYKGE
jgi:hypothetical protein